METKRGGRGMSPVFVELVAGLSAGTLSTVTCHPLEIFKTRMQLAQSKTGTTGTPTSLSLTRDLLKSQHRTAAFYRGITPNLIGNAASWAGFFFLKSSAEELIKSMKYKSADELSKQTTQLTAFDRVISSSVAGLPISLLTNPIFVVKTRMVGSPRSAPGAYQSTWAGVTSIYRKEGLRGFYHGFGISLFGVLQGAIYFPIYEALNEEYRKQKRQAAVEAGQDAGQVELSNTATLVNTAISKSFSGMITYPHTVVRSRLQGHNAAKQFGKGITGVVKGLWKEGGFRAFWRGAVPGTVRFMPSTLVTFLVYENVKAYLPHLVD